MPSNRDISSWQYPPFKDTVSGTYWFTKGGLWFFECPIQVCIGWYIVAYSCVLTAGRIFPHRGVVMAGGHLLFFGIPDTNFFGWFNLIFLFAIFWEKLPKMNRKWGRARAPVVFFS